MKKWEYFNDAEFIYNGEWNDPQLKYKGRVFNYYVVEDVIYANFKDFALDQDVEVNDKNFEMYCKENQDYIREVFEAIALEG